MTTYFIDIEYNRHAFTRDEINLMEFEKCIFTHCDLSQCNLIGVTFIDCRFVNCNFKGTKINHTALRAVQFEYCEMQEVNFAMCDKLLFDISFTSCKLDFAKFYGLKIKKTYFGSCSMIAVDFMNADLTASVFHACNLHQSEFGKANASRVDFRTSYLYTIDPTTTVVAKALFSPDQVKGLLFKHQLVIQ